MSQFSLDIYNAIFDERQRQNRIHPQFPEELRIAILTEEVGEVARALLEVDPENLRDELIQVAAVAVRWLEHMR